MLDFNINLNVKNKIKKSKNQKIKKSNIIKLSDIDYIQTLTFNRKYHIFENIIFKAFL
jgi:hypothetical protein